MLRGSSGSASPSHAAKNGSSGATPAVDFSAVCVLGSVSSRQSWPSPPPRERCDRIVVKIPLSCDGGRGLGPWRPTPSFLFPTAEPSSPSRPMAFSTSTSMFLSRLFSCSLDPVSSCPSCQWLEFGPIAPVSPPALSKIPFPTQQRPWTTHGVVQWMEQECWSIHQNLIHCRSTSSSCALDKRSSCPAAAARAHGCFHFPPLCRVRQFGLNQLRISKAGMLEPWSLCNPDC